MTATEKRDDALTMTCPECDGRKSHAHCVHDLRAALAQSRAVVAFVNDALNAHCTGRWWQDSDMQDKLEAHGLLAPVVVTEPCNTTHCECSAGDTCYRLTPLALAVRALPQPGGTEGGDRVGDANKMIVTDEMVERAARALCGAFRTVHVDGDDYEPFDLCREEGKNVWRGLANMTLTAALTTPAPGGES